MGANVALIFIVKLIVKSLRYIAKKKNTKSRLSVLCRRKRTSVRLSIYLFKFILFIKLNYFDCACNVKLSYRRGGKLFHIKY